MIKFNVLQARHWRVLVFLSAVLSARTESFGKVLQPVSQFGGESGSVLNSLQAFRSFSVASPSSFSPVYRTS
jgi:hypothetical protein